MYMKFRFPRLTAHKTIDGELLYVPISAVISRPAQSLWHRHVHESCAEAHSNGIRKWWNGPGEGAKEGVAVWDATRKR